MPPRAAPGAAAREAGNDVTREYLSEGEYVPGTTPATYYYGPDQIGSVRRVFAKEEGSGGDVGAQT